MKPDPVPAFLPPDPLAETSLPAAPPFSPIPDGSLPETLPPAAPLPPSSRGQHRRVMADAGKLSGAIGLGYFINLVGGVVVAGILGPRMLGIWKTVQLAVQYTQFSNFGISYGVYKLSPSMVSRGLLRRYRALMSVSVGFSLLPALVGGIGLLAAAFWVTDDLARVALLSLVVILPIQQLYHHGELALAIEKRFGTKAKSLFWYTTFRVVLSIMLAKLLGLSGVLIAYIITLLWIVHYMITHSRMGFSPALRLSRIKKLIAVGLPITLVVLGELALGTADKWVVAGVLGAEAMGYYNMAIFPLPLLMLLPMSLRQVVNIEMFDTFGSTGDVKKSLRVYEQSTLIVAMVSPIVIGAVYLGVPWLIAWLLPKFQASLDAVRLHSVLIYSLLIIQTGTGVLIVSGRERTIFAAQVGVALLSAAVSAALAAWAGISFMTVLWIHGIGWVLFGLGFLYATARMLGRSASTALGQTVFWYLPMGLLAVELPLLSWGMMRAGFAPNTFFHATLGGLLHLVLCLPLVLHLERRTGAVSDGWRMIRRRLGFRVSS